MPFETKFDFQRPFPPLNPTENAIRSLAAAVVCQAIEDWITIIRSGKYVASKGNYFSYAEIQEFLSDEGFGEDLCDFLNVDSARILSELEQHRRNFDNYGILPPNILKRNDPTKYE